MQASNQVRVEEPGGVRGRFRIAGGDLKDAEAQIRASVSGDHTRPVLTGVLVSVVEGRVRMVATDSYRLAIKEMRLLAPASGELEEALIPGQAMRHAARIARRRESVEIAVSRATASIRLVDMELNVRLLAGTFPDYLRLWPDGFEREVVVPREDFLEALERVRPPRRRKSLPAPVRLTFSSGSLELLMEDEEFGRSRETIEAASDNAEGYSVAFNPVYLADGVKATDGDAVRLCCNEPMEPALITPATKEGVEPGFRYLVMPMRWTSSK